MLSAIVTDYFCKDTNLFRDFQILIGKSKSQKESPPLLIAILLSGGPKLPNDDYSSLIVSPDYIAASRKSVVILTADKLSLHVVDSDSD